MVANNGFDSSSELTLFFSASQTFKWQLQLVLQYTMQGFLVPS